MTGDIKRGKGSGYIGKNKRICMIYCFECGAENYALAVSSGSCAWCGHDPNRDEKLVKALQA